MIAHIIIGILIGVLITVVTCIYLPFVGLFVQNLQAKALIRTGKKLIEKSADLALDVAIINEQVNQIKNGTGTD